MKKTLLSTLVAATLLTASTLTYAAQDSFYIGAKVGSTSIRANDYELNVKNAQGYVNSHGDSNVGKILGNVSVGYSYELTEQQGLRAELAYTYRGEMKDDDLHNYAEGKLGMNTLMLNGYYDYKFASKTVVYGLIGVGLAFDKLDYNAHYLSVVSDLPSETKTKFAWAIGGGVLYPLMTNLDMDISLQYVDGGKMESSTATANSEAKISAIDLGIGLRYSF